MDQGLAVHAQFLALYAGAAEAGVVIEVEMHPVEHREAGGASCQDAEFERRHERQPVRRVVCAEVLGQVRGAEHETGNTRMREGDLFGVENAEWCLHHAPDRVLGVSAGAIEHGNGVGHHFRALHLRQQHPVAFHYRHRLQVVGTPGPVQAVGTDQNFAHAVAALFECGGNLAARGGLGIRCDRVFEIEDQPIGGQHAALFHGAVVGPRHVENGSARTCCRWHGNLRERTLAGQGRQAL